MEHDLSVFGSCHFAHPDNQAKKEGARPDGPPGGEGNNVRA